MVALEPIRQIEQINKRPKAGLWLLKLRQDGNKDRTRRGVACDKTATLALSDHDVTAELTDDFNKGRLQTVMVLEEWIE